jgi:hypothetical protein
LISGNPELGLRSFLFREEHDGQTPRPASYSKVRAGYFNRLLGDMIGKIRNAAAGQALEAAKPILSDLESLNDYTKRYHHDDNSVITGSGTPQDGELQPFAKLTLQLTNRL